MSNWNIGIDHSLSTPGGVQVAKAGYFFVDAVNGSDANDGSPGSPWQTYQYAVDQMGISNTVIRVVKNIPFYSKTIVLADGWYEFTTDEFNNTDYNFNTFANNPLKVIFEYTGAKPNPVTDGRLLARGGGGYYFNGIKFINCVGSSFVRQNFYEDCIINNQYLITSAEGDLMVLRNVKTINVQLRLNQLTSSSMGGVLIDTCVFDDDCNIETLTGRGGAIEIINSHFDSGVNIEVSNENVVQTSISNSNWRGTVSNVDGGSTSITLSSNIDADLLLNGALNDFQFTIENNSPLIGAGENNSTIGNLRIGQLVNLSGATNNDITTSPDIVITNPATTGNAIPTKITFDQVRMSPIVDFDGFIEDNTNNIPDNETATQVPKRLVVNVSWSATQGGSLSSGNFLYGYPMYKDDLGNYTGEDDFDWSNIDDGITTSNLIAVRDIQPNFVLNDQ